MKRVKVISLLLVMILVSFLVLYKTGVLFNSPNEERDGGISYRTSDEVDRTLTRLAQNTEKTGLVKAYAASQRKVVITFSGMGTPSEMDQIIKLLQEYNVSATFFLDAVSASEDVETVQMIQKSGFTIGSYGFSAEKHWDKLTPEKLAISLAKNQAVLRSITGKTPTYFSGNATKYTDMVLHVAKSAGLENGVEASNFLSDTSLPNFNSALGFASSLSNGAIISVKIGNILDEMEYAPSSGNMKPEEGENNAPLERTHDIVLVVKYFLEALNSIQTAVVPLERLDIDPDKLIDEALLSRENAVQYQVGQSASVDMNYYRDALFIGDSLTQALGNYSDLRDNATFCAYKSITPMQIVNNIKATGMDGIEVSVLDKIKNQSPGKIYVLLGANALATGSDGSLILYYDRLIEILKSQFKGVPIYIQGLPPVTKNVSTNKVTLNNGRIRKINVEIAKLAGKQGCYYIDLYSSFANEGGNLPMDVAQEDGIHLNKKGCTIWMNYLSTHVVKN